MTSAFDLLLFVILPYVAAVVCGVGTIERYRRHAFSFTSHSTQVLENRLHFWALVPFHAGVLTIVLGHVIAFAVPRGLLAWNAVPLRLYVLEAAALAAGLLALGGFSLAILRRALVSPVRGGTGWLDWIVYAVLLGNLATGVLVAVWYPWGSSWFAATLTPYLRSLVRLQPDAAIAAAMPWLVRVHIVGAWLLVALFPFSRLVHIVAVPNPYLWRPPQVVRWYGPRPRFQQRSRDRQGAGRQSTANPVSRRSAGGLSSEAPPQTRERFASPDRTGFGRLGRIGRSTDKLRRPLQVLKSGRPPGAESA